MTGSKKGLGLLCAAMLLLAGCERLPYMQDSGFVRVIGHGGEGFADKAVYPPNSLASIYRALDVWDADGVEVDVRMSSDGILFLFHEAFLEAASFCAGCVHATPAHVLEACYFKHLNGAAGSRSALATVESLLGELASRQPAPLVFLDIKHPFPCEGVPSDSIYYDAVFREIHRLVRSYDMADRIVVQSAYAGWLDYARGKMPEMRLMLDYVAAETDIREAADRGFWGVAAPSEDFTQDMAALAGRLGLRVQLYGERSRSGIIEALEKGPDYFLTDNILLTKKILSN